MNRTKSAATTNATLLKASAGKIIAVIAHNTAGYDVYLKFYDKAAAPTVGADTPIITLRLPTGQTFIWEPPSPKRLFNGIAFAITKNAADSDATAVAAGDLLLTIDYG